MRTSVLLRKTADVVDVSLSQRLYGLGICVDTKQWPKVSDSLNRDTEVELQKVGILLNSNSYRQLISRLNVGVQRSTTARAKRRPWATSLAIGPDDQTEL